MNSEQKIIPVGTKTDPARLAGAIAGFLRDGKDIALRCLGVGSTATAGRALAVARSFVISNDLGILERPRFEDRMIEGVKRTVLRIGLDTYPIKR